MTAVCPGQRREEPAGLPFGFVSQVRWRNPIGISTRSISNGLRLASIVREVSEPCGRRPSPVMTRPAAALLQRYPVASGVHSSHPAQCDGVRSSVAAGALGIRPDRCAEFAGRISVYRRDGVTELPCIPLPRTTAERIDHRAIPFHGSCRGPSPLVRSNCCLASSVIEHLQRWSESRWAIDVSSELLSELWSRYTHCPGRAVSNERLCSLWRPPAVNKHDRSAVEARRRLGSDRN